MSLDLHVRDLENYFCAWSEIVDERPETARAPTPKEWARLRARFILLFGAARKLRDAAPEGAQAAVASAVKPRAPKPEPSYPFVIDQSGFARRGTGNRNPVRPDEVTDTIYDMRGMDGDMKTIVWADGSTGLNGRELTIVAV